MCNVSHEIQDGKLNYHGVASLSPPCEEGPTRLTCLHSLHALPA